MRFAGYPAIYAEAPDDASPDEESTGSLPDIHQDETLRLLGCQPEQHFTQPTPRFSEAVRGAESVACGRAPALPGPGLRLDGRARRGRGRCSRARRQGFVDQRGWPDQALYAVN